MSESVLKMSERVLKTSEPVLKSPIAHTLLSIGITV